VSSHHATLTFEYIHKETEELEEAFGGSAGGGIPRPRTFYWSISRRGWKREERVED